MKITIEQLKEIAKAGYESDIIDSYSEKMEMSFIEGCDPCVDEYRLSINDKSTWINNLFIFYFDNRRNFVEFWHENGFTFNHLAAIRKMEELGLIKKEE